MNEQEDFLSIMKDEIAHKGIVVVDDVKRLPLYQKPYVSPLYVICINHHGMVNIEYEDQSAIFQPRHIAVVYPYHKLLVHSSSKDYKSTLVIVSEQLYSKIAMISSHSSRFQIEQQPHFLLTPNQYANLTTLIDALRLVTRIEPPLHKDLILAQLHVLIQFIIRYRTENEGNTVVKTGRISSLLYDAIIKHYQQHRSVEFYASLFCLSPKYFSSAIKEETGHSASYWIEQHVILMAKSLLRTETQLSLQEISDRMGFPDIATFSRYFKRATGITPSKYRQEY